MPYLIGLFFGALSLTLKSLVGRVLLALGVSYMTYTGIDLLIGSIQDDAFALISGLPPEFSQIVGMTKIGEALSVLVSALSAKYVILGLQSGSITRMIIK